MHVLAGIARDPQSLCVVRALLRSRPSNCCVRRAAHPRWLSPDGNRRWRQRMTRLCSYVGVAVLALCSLAYAQAGKLSDQDFKKVAQSHSTADEHQKLAAHYTAHAIA